MRYGRKAKDLALPTGTGNEIFMEVYDNCDLFRIRKDCRGPTSMLTESVYREEYQTGTQIYREGEPGTGDGIDACFRQHRALVRISGVWLDC